MLTAEQVAEVRRICQFEHVRYSFFALASECMDDQVRSLELRAFEENGQLSLDFAFKDQSGAIVAGGAL